MLASLQIIEDNVSICSVAYYVAEGAPKRFFDSSDEGRLFLRTQPCKKVHGFSAYSHLASRGESIENVALRLIAMLPDQLLFSMKSSGGLKRRSVKNILLIGMMGIGSVLTII